HYSLYILFFITFFFNDPSPPELYTLSLHDALPIFVRSVAQSPLSRRPASRQPESGDSSFRAALTLTAWTDFHRTGIAWLAATLRSEEHTSELQSPYDLVCRLLLEKKKKNRDTNRKCRLALRTNYTARVSPWRNYLWTKNKNRIHQHDRVKLRQHRKQGTMPINETS